MNWIFSFWCLVFSIFALPNLASAQIYRLKGSYNVRSTKNFSVDTSENGLGVLNSGDQIKVLETKTLPSGVKAFRIEVLDSKSKIKSSKTGDIWIRKSRDKDFVTESGVCTTCGETAGQLSEVSKKNISELKALPEHIEKTTQVANDDDDDDDNIKVSGSADDTLLQKIKNYSSSKQVAKLAQIAKNLKARHGGGKCYREVKKALDAAKLAVRSQMQSEPARLAKQDLKKQGFINLLEVEPYASTLKSPSDAPKGAVLVYSSGIACRRSKTPDCGHVEIKVGEPGQPGYMSDYKSDDAISETPFAKKAGSRYKLIGVMIKPMDAE